MSDYRLGLNIEHGEDRSYVVYEATGQRYEIRSFDMKRKEHEFLYQDTLHFFKPPSRNWDLYLGLVEVPPVPLPTTKPKRRLSDLGLRRPK